MVVTIDTGILVRATARSNGPARRLLELLLKDPSYVLTLSPFILGEVGKVLSYPRLSRVLHISPEEVLHHLEYLRSISRIVEPKVGLPVTLTDPQDDPIVYTAIAAGADILCTRDRAFYQPNVIAFFNKYGIEVMDDLRLLAQLESF